MTTTLEWHRAGDRGGGAVKREPHRWTREETEFLERHYTAQGAAWVAQRLGLTAKQVYNRAEHLGRSDRRLA